MRVVDHDERSCSCIRRAERSAAETAPDEIARLIGRFRARSISTVDPDPADRKRKLASSSSDTADRTIEGSRRRNAIS